MKKMNFSGLLGLTTTEFYKFALPNIFFGSLIVIFIFMVTRSFSTTIVTLFVVVMIGTSIMLMKRQSFLHEETCNAYAMLSMLDMIYSRIAEGMSLMESFESIRQYADRQSIQKINNLLNECEIDSTPNPFIHLASYYQNQRLKSMLLTIATIRDHSPTERILSELFVQLSETHHAVSTDYLKYADLEYRWFTLHPLVASFIFVASYGISVLALIAN